MILHKNYAYDNRTISYDLSERENGLMVEKRVVETYMDDKREIPVSVIVTRKSDREEVKTVIFKYSDKGKYTGYEIKELIDGEMVLVEAVTNYVANGDYSVITFDTKWYEEDGRVKSEMSTKRTYREIKIRY